MKITFEKGILGFEGIKEYTLKDLESNPTFRELNSIKEKELGFIMAGICVVAAEPFCGRKSV